MVFSESTSLAGRRADASLIIVHRELNSEDDDFTIPSRMYICPAKFIVS